MIVVGIDDRFDRGGLQRLELGLGDRGECILQPRTLAPVAGGPKDRQSAAGGGSLSVSLNASSSATPARQQ